MRKWFTRKIVQHEITLHVYELITILAIEGLVLFLWWRVLK